MELQILRTKHPPEIYHAQLANLISEEGYSTMPEDIKNRLRLLPTKDRLLLAVDGETLLGYAHLRVSEDLVNEETAEVVAIVVEASNRRSGIGTRLISAAETWATQSGRARLLLKTDVVRTPAHAFFSALGYEKDSTTIEFIRILDRPNS
jgi:GNAT superfamily N-acetyltransferase